MYNYKKSKSSTYNFKKIAQEQIIQQTPDQNIQVQDQTVQQPQNIQQQVIAQVETALAQSQYNMKLFGEPSLESIVNKIKEDVLVIKNVKIDRQKITASIQSLTNILNDIKSREVLYDDNSLQVIVYNIEQNLKILQNEFAGAGFGEGAYNFNTFVTLINNQLDKLRNGAEADRLLKTH